MSRASASSLPPPDLRRVAVAASCDPRTVEAYLAGRRVLPAILAAVEAALRAIGRQDLVRPAGDPA